MQATTTATQPPSTPVIEPDSGAVKAAEQLTLPVIPVVSVTDHVNPLVEPVNPVVEPVTQAQRPVIPVVPVAQPTSTPTTTVSQGSQTGVKEELKAVEGASLPSVKYARIAGLLAKSLNEFKLQFEASFPKDDMARAVAAANCTIVDGKVVFIGG